MQSLIQPLFDGPIDVVGDVHGEDRCLAGVARSTGLRCGAGPRHAAGRRLAFVGDLTDRGPDNPAVVAAPFAHWSKNGRGSNSVLGNHDLRHPATDHEKDEQRRWFRGERFHDAAGNVVPQVLADDATRAAVVELLSHLAAGPGAGGHARRSRLLAAEDD